MATSRVDSSQLDALPAGVDLSDKVFHCVTVSASGMYVPGSTQRVDGILTEGNIVGKPVTFQTAGVAKVKAGAALSAGKEVMCDANGKVVTASGSGSHIVGVSLSAAGAEDEIIPVQLRFAKVA